MRYLKMYGAMGVLLLMAAVGAGGASATELTDSAGMLASGASVAFGNEGTLVLHTAAGDVECNRSTIGAATGNTGGAGETVKIQIQVFSMSECNATETVRQNGSLEVHTAGASANNNGTVTSSGTEITTEFFGTHCIFKTSATDIGVLTGGTPGTLDIEATLPRIGGRSGVFCGSSGQWTGAYEVLAPSRLIVH